MNKQAILRTAASAIRSKAVHYEWRKSHSCNCGVVAQVVMGTSGVALRDSLERPLMEVSKCIDRDSGRSPTWSDMTRVLCPVTGLPENDIFLALHNAGFTAEELRQLEYLKNKEICRRAGIDTATTRTETTIYGYLWWKKTETREVNLDTFHYERPSDVADYLDAWASMLDEQSDELEPQLQADADRLMAKA